MFGGGGVLSTETYIGCAPTAMVKEFRLLFVDVSKS